MSIDPGARLKAQIAGRVMAGSPHKQVAENITDEWLQKRQNAMGRLMNIIEELRPDPGSDTLYNQTLDDMQDDARGRAYGAGRRLWERKNL